MKHRAKRFLALGMLAILVLCLALSALSRGYEKSPVSFGKLEQWVSEDLPKDGMGAFSNKLEMVQDQSGRSLRAKDVVAEGEIMVRAPFTRCFSLYTAFQSDIGSVLYALYTDLGVEEMDIIRLFLMQELLLQSESDFWPTIENWPNNPGSSIYFTPKELDELQNKQLAQATLETKQSLLQSYRDTMVNGKKIFSEFPTVFKPELYTTALWTKASVFIWSRYFNCDITMTLPTGMTNPIEPLPARPYHGGAVVHSRMAMVPALSMINHAANYPYCNVKNGKSTFEYVEATKVFQLINVIEIPRGEPVYWCYNEFSNADLLEDYGFALSLDLNPWEEVTIFINDGAFYSGLESLEGSQKYKIKARNLLKPELTLQLVSKLSRFVECPSGAKGGKPDCGSNVGRPPDAGNASRAAQMLRDLLHRLPTTLAADQAMLLDQAAVDALGPHGAPILTFRIAQKTLLDRTAVALDAAAVNQ